MIGPSVRYSIPITFNIFWNSCSHIIRNQTSISCHIVFSCNATILIEVYSIQHIVKDGRAKNRNQLRDHDKIRLCHICSGSNQFKRRIDSCSIFITFRVVQQFPATGNSALSRLSHLHRSFYNRLACSRDITGNGQSIKRIVGTSHRHHGGRSSQFLRTAEIERTVRFLGQLNGYCHIRITSNHILQIDLSSRSAGSLYGHTACSGCLTIHLERSIVTCDFSSRQLLPGIVVVIIATSCKYSQCKSHRGHEEQILFHHNLKN